MIKFILASLYFTASLFCLAGLTQSIQQSSITAFAFNAILLGINACLFIDILCN